MSQFRNLALALFVAVVAASSAVQGAASTTSTVVGATNIYVAQSAQGGDTGADCADAHVYSFFNSASNWGTGSGQIGPGATVHICGTISVASGATAFKFQQSGASGSPITLLFEPGAKLLSPNWSTAITGNGTSWIVIDGGSNGLVQNTLTGTPGGSCPGGPCTISPSSTSDMVSLSNCSNAVIRNLTIGDAYDHSSASDNNADGASISLNGGSNLLVTGNTLHDSRYGIFYGPNNGNSNVTISNNIIYRIDAGTAVGIGNSGIALNGFYFFGNEIHDFANWNNDAYTFHHDGLHIWLTQSSDALSNCFIYNNYWHGDFGHGTSLTYIENEGGSATHSTCYVFNNIYAPTAASGGNGFGGVWVQTDSSSTPTVFVYNNTFTGGGLTTFNPIWIEGTNINETIQNNIIYNVGNGVNFSSSGSGLPTSNFNVWNTATNGSMFNCGNGSCPNLGNGSFGAWQSLGEDALGSSANPNLNPNFSLQSSSPARNIGTNLSATCTGQAVPGLGALCSDRNGNARPSLTASGSWDAGSAQFQTGTQPPNPPSGLSATAH